MTDQPFKDYTLCYLPDGRVTHMMWDHDGSPNDTSRPSLCGAAPQWHDPRGWWGTGSQVELEKALDRPTCRTCLRLMRMREAR